jgi:hypothetical protein
VQNLRNVVNHIVYVQTQPNMHVNGGVGIWGVEVLMSAAPRASVRLCGASARVWRRGLGDTGYGMCGYECQIGDGI